ncbi:MAG TPA: protease inhibitor I42 family protein [Methanosarcina sp.]|nr:protease inhibitor I42 family protein [Methanosarcina sp.]
MSEIVIEQDDLGHIIEADPSDVIVLRLEENLTTGYMWEVETQGSVVELIESTHVENKGIAMGCAGVRVLRFVLKSAGSQEIHLRLRRSWDPPYKALKHLDVTIWVRQS